VNCCVAPTATLAVEGVTLTDVTGFAADCTVNAAEPLIPLREAVTVVDPAAVAVTTPVALTDAIDPDPTLHVDVEVTLAVEPSL
jgi:hypothetical protein